MVDTLVRKLDKKVAERLKKSGYDEASRFNQAKSLVLADNARLLRYLGDNYKLRVYFVSDSLTPVACENPELFEAIRSA